MIAWLLVACATGSDSAAPPPAPTLVPLADVALARRISLDLRGVTPTLDELDRAEAGELDALVDDWLADPRHEAHLVDVFAEAWALRADLLRIGPAEFGYDDADLPWFARALEDEPARLMAHIAVSDRPWTDIVQADHTLADADLAALVPLVREDVSDPDAWTVAHYTDGRPALGVLATSGLWARFATTRFNYNRTRGAAITRELLCTDLLDRPVSFVAVTDASPGALEAATREMPACVACHASLDPLSASLFGFWPYEDKDGAELVTYHPEREPLGADLLQTTPAWYGQPLDGVAQLGPAIAADPRFTGCAVRRAAEWLWQRGPDAADHEALTALEAAFTADLRYATLVRAVLATDEYRAGAHTADAPDADTARLQVRRSLSAPALASFVEELTGFRWEWEGWHQLDADASGYRVLAGGVDGESVHTPARDPSVSRALVIKRLAQAGADAVVADDPIAPPEARRLLGTTGEDVLTFTPDSAALEAELARVHRRVLGAAPDAERLAAERSLWVDAYALGGAAAAWRTTVAALLRDPDAWSY